jgi:aquaporin Z
MDRRFYLNEEESNLFRRKRLARNGRRFLAELLGTMVLTFATSLASMLQFLNRDLTNPQVSHLAVALSNTGLIFALSQISGAHFNPIVTLAFVMRREFKLWRLPLYLLAQLCGAIIAAALLYWHFGRIDYLGASIPKFINTKQAFGLELIFALIFVLVVLNVSERGRLTGTNAALATGVTLASIALLGSTLTTASINPASSFATAIFGGRFAWRYFWIYLVAPIVGSIIATICTYLLSHLPPGLNKRAEREATGRGTNIEALPLASE